MRALVFSAPGKAEVAEAQCPAPGPGEVLVRSRAVGICHSDLELLAGRYIIPIRYPITPGHEWAGEVAETGPGVDGLKQGDPVVGECVVGPGGRDHFGFSISGAAAQYFLARAEWLHKIPAHLTWTQGALVEPFSVAYAAVRAGVIDPSDRVAVLGGGPIGLLSAMAAVGRNATVTLIEPRPDRRAKAADLGVSSVLDPTAGDLPGQAREATGGDMFDVVIESAGHPEAMAQALTIAGSHGRIVYVGIDVGNTIPAELGLIQARSLRIQGIVGSAGIWPQAIRFLAAGVVDPARIVTASYPLGAATDALGAAALGSGNIKVHIEVSP
ncbi:MAG: zinc-binding dehydrogenase [Nocardiopsaceae bacterium]|jgi:L-iditol 2-dehydrogenase|nr:zinc-binding dehydrogenase [Nocardiopsaceae bacterium]